MPAVPAVNPLSVIVAAVVSFLIVGMYWAFIANALTRALGGGSETTKVPLSALAAAFFTRVLLCCAIATLLACAGAKGGVGGSLFGALAFIGFLLPMLIGQAAWDRHGSWTRFLVGVPEALLGVAVMGAIVVAWAT